VALTKAERQSLIEKLFDLDRRRYPSDPALAPGRYAAQRLNDDYYQTIAEYGDRLPRVMMGACPFTGAPLMASLDPLGLDGPWWWKDRTFEISEPEAPPTFRLLLGGLALSGRQPVEVTDEVIPGPEVPFVVPRLLQLPGMVAVVSQIVLDNGDVAFPISYWSEAEIDPSLLHQPWLRQELWVQGPNGPGWLIANDVWSFDLPEWIARDKVMRIEQGGKDVRGRTSGSPCPYVNLKGDQLPQMLAGGERELLELPDGRRFDPFYEEPEGPEPEDDLDDEPEDDLDA